MFWQRLIELCRENGTSPSAVAREIGMKSAGTATAWKNGSVPRADVIERIAKYFNVPVSSFYNSKPIEYESKPNIDNIDDTDNDLVSLMIAARDRPECRVLFRMGKNATKEEVQQMIRIMGALKGNE